LRKKTEAWILELCQLEEQSFTLANFHFESLKACWQETLKVWYRDHPAALNTPSVQPVPVQRRAGFRPESTALVGTNQNSAVVPAFGTQRRPMNSIYPPELPIMASILAYSELSVTTMIDIMAKKIAHTMLTEFVSEMGKLSEKLRLHEEGGGFRVKAFTTETVEIQNVRRQLGERRNDLEMVMKELGDFGPIM
jgi:hypothetical protein